ncbi:MAG TPA: tetratricopeptide repeat protein [Stenomitos sp.]
MVKQKVVRRAKSHAEEIPERPKRGLVVRIGIAIVGLAVVISSLVPLISLFDRTPREASNPFASLEEAARQDPTNASTQVMLGNAYYDAQRYADAVGAYQKALALKPGDPNVEVDYGTSLFYVGKADEALKTFKAVLKSNPKHFQAHLNMGVVYRSQGKVSEAIASWKQAEAVAPSAEIKQHVTELITKAAVSTFAK